MNISFSLFWRLHSKLIHHVVAFSQRILNHVKSKMGFGSAVFLFQKMLPQDNRRTNSILGSLVIYEYVIEM